MSSQRWAFLLILGVLLLVSVQTVFGLFREVNLAGAFLQYSYETLGPKTWFSGEFQQAADRKTTSDFGFRSYMVRSFNQVNYSVFGTINPQVREGREGMLFEAAYERAVCGNDRLSDEWLETKTDSLARLDSLLQARGKKLYVLIAPNKWRYHSDRAPWSCKPSASTNYTSLLRQLHSREVATIDCIELFETWKATTPHPLHAPSGTHWSIYGAWRVADRLNDRLKQDGFSMPVLQLDSLELVDESRNTDKDLFDLLNVLQKAPRTPLAYPHVSTLEDSQTKSVVIGDSYYWTFFYLDLHDQLWAEDSPFLYYDQYRAPGSGERVEIEPGQREQWLKEADVVIVMVNEPAIPRLGYGFLEGAIQFLEQQPI